MTSPIFMVKRVVESTGPMLMVKTICDEKVPVFMLEGVTKETAPVFKSVKQELGMAEEQPNISMMVEPPQSYSWMKCEFPIEKDRPEEFPHVSVTEIKEEQNMEDNNEEENDVLMKSVKQDIDQADEDPHISMIVDQPQSYLWMKGEFPIEIDIAEESPHISMTEVMEQENLEEDMSNTRPLVTDERRKDNSTVKSEVNIENLPELPPSANYSSHSLPESAATSRHFRDFTQESTEERLHSCTMCKSTFKRSSHLKEHKRIHTGERPYSCTACEASFTKLCNLKTHLRTHTGERPYSCTQCHLRFTQSGSLRRHMRTHKATKQ